MIVTVVVPIFNQVESVLRECVASILSQSHQSLEVILCDNHSNNGTESLIDGFALQDSRVSVIRPPKHLNLGDSFIFALGQGQSEFVCYLSSDDILEHRCIEAQLDVLAGNADVDLCHGKAIYFGADQKDRIAWEYFDSTGIHSPNRNTINKLLDFSYICFCGCLLRRTKLEEILSKLAKSDKDLRLVLDTYLIGEFIEDSKIGFLNEVVGRVRVNGDISHRTLTVIKDSIQIFNHWDSHTLVTKYFTPNERINIKRKYFSRLVFGAIAAMLRKQMGVDEMGKVRKFIASNRIEVHGYLRLLALGLIFLPNTSIIIYQLVKIFRSGFKSD